MKERKHANLWRIIEENEPSDPGITAEEFASRYGVCYDVAFKRLEKLLEKGKLVGGMKRNSRGRRVKVYRAPDDR
jgi:ribosomal protein S25